MAEDHARLPFSPAGQPQDGSIGIDIAYRCSGEIVWNTFESCIVVFDTDARSGRPVDFRTDDCDI